MSNKIYNWKRFWCPRTGRIYLSDDGYLYDPDSEWGSIYNPNVVSFESISKVPCLALLGEPGIGKSYAMQSEQKAIDVKIEKEGEQTLWMDLREYGSEDRVVRNLFENPTFVSWAKGSHRLHVFLDSLDECLLRIDNLAALVIGELRKYPVERLYPRIACRSADWPLSLEGGLRQLWGDDVVKVYELAPLRRVDVVEAAQSSGLDPGKFLAEIDRMEVVPLAIKPVTLDFLLNTYQRIGRLPSTQAELYLQGCRLLCEETSESRRNARLTGTFTSGQRMAMAARIAAVTVFANRYAVRTSVDRGDVFEEDTTVQELCGGSESVDGEQFQVTEAAIKETLSTGLFSSRGPNRMGWAHHTYAEFLAARYLVEHEMPLAQMMSLIIHPGDPEGKLVPQLHETAAWLAGMIPDVFQEIMGRDPEVLLRSDVAAVDAKSRAALVGTLLKLYDEGELLDRDFDIHRHYRKLAHPSLTEQLRPYICDSAKGIVVRRVAIDIAEACELRTLQGEFVDIALDPSQPYRIRTHAAAAICFIGNDDAKAKLRPLTTGEAGEDPDDELKGCGLRAVWPTHMTAKELFTIVTPRKRPRLIGAYEMFLAYELIKHLRPSDLQVALEWVEKQKSRGELQHPFEELVDTIMLQAWEHLETPGVLKAFTKAVLSRFRQYDEIIGGKHASQFRNALSDNDEKRRQVLEAILPMLSDSGKELKYLIYSETPLAMSKDIPWMIKRLRIAASNKDKQKWAQLIHGVFNWQVSDQVDAILVACKEDTVLRDTFVHLIKSVELDSPEAKKMKADYLEMQKWQKRNEERPLLKPSPTERITMLLDEFEMGNLAAWWRLNMEMMLEPDSTDYGDELESDLTILPGWKSASAKTRARIVEAAKKYVSEQNPETNKWLGTNTLYRPAFAGYRALRLLLQKAPDFVSTIPADVWKRWAPLVLVYPISSGTGDKEPHYKLVEIAYQNAPTEIIESLMVMIDKENEEHGHILITRKVKGCWDDCLVSALLIKAKDKKLKPESMSDLLSDLLGHDVNGAKMFAESLVPSPLPSSGTRRTKAIVAARVLIIYAEDAGWSVIWPAIQQDVEFGREMISAIARISDPYAENIGQRLTENQLADLYIWLVHQYPYAEDPKHEEVHLIISREDMAHFRASILHHLKDRGTPQASEAIRRIASELPELDWLKWTLLEAQKIARYHTWVPPRPSDILKMASERYIRLVQNGDELLDVLIESLKRLEAKLQGETPAAIDLWNETVRNVYRPKDENRLSDYVKRHLDDDLKQRGVIVNREVEIRRGEGTGQGERTDIHVDAVVRGPHGEVYDSISAIIEVKGCWNPDLNHAMKTQLVDRYMDDNRCQQGLYLIGWFNCNQWNDKDRRKRQAPQKSINEAQKQFDAQAAELSQQGKRIKAFVINTALR